MKDYEILCRKWRKRLFSTFWLLVALERRGNARHNFKFNNQLKYVMYVKYVMEYCLLSCGLNFLVGQRYVDLENSSPSGD